LLPPLPERAKGTFRPSLVVIPVETVGLCAAGLGTSEFETTGLLAGTVGLELEIGFTILASMIFPFSSYLIV